MGSTVGEALVRFLVCGTEIEETVGFGGPLAGGGDC